MVSGEAGTQPGVATGRSEGVQECVQERKRKGCESQFRPSHPVRLTPQLFTYLAKLAFSAACSRARAPGHLERTTCTEVAIRSSIGAPTVCRKCPEAPGETLAKRLQRVRLRTL